eukprot:3418589-Prymnesium_polylepis.1
MAGAPHKTEDLALLLDDYAVFVGAVLANRNPGLALAVQMPWTETGILKSLQDLSQPRFKDLAGHSGPRRRNDGAFKEAALNKQLPEGLKSTPSASKLREAALNKQLPEGWKSTPSLSTSQQALSPMQQVTASQRSAFALQLIQQALSDLGATSTNADVPLMESGLDSLAATDLSFRLGSAAGVELSSTLAFDQPTPRAVASHL